MFDFFSRLKYSDPDLWVLVKHWPVTVFLPAILLLVASLALVTRVWDQHQDGAAESAGEGAGAD